MRTILSRTGSDVTMIPEVANHLINSGGKRLRPMLTLAMARLTGYPGDGHVKLAAAVEFMHTATLLHDDVVDESEMRRGRLAARMLWGNEASVLVGDFLLGQAFKMMVEVGSLRALDILSSAAAVIAEGEVMQLGAAKNTATTEDEYLAVIRAKTAELFAAACEVGPAIAGRSKDEQAACRSYGMNLGIAFQLVDDALDYGGKSAKLGKNVGDDFRDGKITLPVVLSFRRGSDSERVFWRRTLEDGDATDNDLETAVSLMIKHRALEDTIKRARHYGSIAKDALALFPDFADEGGAGRGGRFLRSAGRARPSSVARHPPAGMRVLADRVRRLARHRTKRTSQSRSRPSPTCGQGGTRESAQGRSTSAMTGCSAIAGASRSLRRAVKRRKQRVGARTEANKVRPVSSGADKARRGKCRKHVPGRNRHARIDQHRRQLRQPIGAERISPIPRIMRGRGSRHTGTSAPVAARPRTVAVVERKPVGARKQPQCRRGIGRTAAEPGCDRQPLVEFETTEPQPRDTRRRARARP